MTRCQSLFGGCFECALLATFYTAGLLSNAGLFSVFFSVLPPSPPSPLSFIILFLWPIFGSVFWRDVDIWGPVFWTAMVVLFAWAETRSCDGRRLVVAGIDAWRKQGAWNEITKRVLQSAKVGFAIFKERFATCKVQKLVSWVAKYKIWFRDLLRMFPVCDYVIEIYYLKGG